MVPTASKELKASVTLKQKKNVKKSKKKKKLLE